MTELETWCAFLAGGMVVMTLLWIATSPAVRYVEDREAEDRQRDEVGLEPAPTVSAEKGGAEWKVDLDKYK